MMLEAEGKTKMNLRDEVTRVTKEIENAQKKLTDLNGSLIMTRQKADKMNELRVAIAVGLKYKARLKERAGL